MPAGKLTLKQQRFLAAFLESGNGGAAYRAAYDRGGMSDQAAWSHASRLLKHPAIAARLAEQSKAIQARIAKAAEACGVTAERLVAEYAAVAFFEIGQIARWNSAGELVLTDSSRLTAAQRAGIAAVALDGKTQSVKITTSLSSKLAALDSLARLLGLLEKEKPEALEQSPLNLSITIT